MPVVVPGGGGGGGGAGAVALGIPPPWVGTETGLDDSSWIAWVRDAFGDQPVVEQDQQVNVDGLTGQFSALGAPFVTSHKPLWDSGQIFVTVNATVYTTVPYPQTPDTNVVQVNYDTGELVFNPVPAAGTTVTVVYQRVKFTDNTILMHLHAAVKAMSMKGLFRTFMDESVQLAVNRWDYPLPAWASDPRSRITRVDVLPARIPTLDWQTISHWERSGQDRIHIPDAMRWAPLGWLRITGIGPYTGLGDLEPELYHLPIMYCMGMMHMKQESKRVRSDLAVPQREEGAVAIPVLTNANLGKEYLQQFNQELAQRSRATGAGSHGKFTAPRYARRLSAYR